MSKITKAIKRVSAVAASTLLLSSAAYANLGNYASNFEKDGKFVGNVVVGTGVGADDSAAANVIVSDLKSKYASNSEDRYVLTYTKTEGEGSSVSLGDDLYKGDAISKDEASFDSDDLSFLKEDKIVKDEEGSEYRYDEKLLISNSNVSEEGAIFDFDWNSDLEEAGYDGDEPIPFVRLYSEPLYVLQADFTDDIRFTDSSGSTDSDSSNFQKDSIRGESINLFGREFVLSGKNRNDSDIELFTSSTTIKLRTGGRESYTFENNGKSYEVKVLEANAEDSEALILVNGKEKFVETDESENIGGLNVYVKKVFVGDVVLTNGQKTLYVELFLGGDVITIPRSAESDFVELEVGDDELNDYFVRVIDESPDNEFGEIRGIEFAFAPQRGDDSTDYILEGQTFQDPFFPEVSFTFEGYSPAIGKDDYEIEFDADGDTGKISFTPVSSNREITLNLFSFNTSGAGAVEFYNSSSELFRINVANGTDLVDGDVFILSDDDNSDEETKIFRVESFSGNVDDGNDREVSLKDLTTGSTKTYKIDDEIFDNVKVQELTNTSSASSTFKTAGSNSQPQNSASSISALRLSSPTLSHVVSKGGVKINLSSASIGQVIVTELHDQDDRDLLSADAHVGNVVFRQLNSDQELQVGFTENATNSNKLESDDDDNEFFITNVGTFIKDRENSDNEGISVNFNVPDSERTFSASINVGQTSTKSTETVSASKLDERFKELEEKYGTGSVSKSLIERSDVSFDVTAPVNDANAGSSDNIVVGGPAVNSKAKDLLGSGVVGVSEGQAVVRYFSSSNSILVYGYSKEGTLAAAKKLVSGSAKDNEKFNQ